MRTRLDDSPALSCAALTRRSLIGRLLGSATLLAPASLAAQHGHTGHEQQPGLELKLPLPRVESSVFTKLVGTRETAPVVIAFGGTIGVEGSGSGRPEDVEGLLQSEWTSTETEGHRAVSRAVLLPPSGVENGHLLGRGLLTGPHELHVPIPGKGEEFAPRGIGKPHWSSIGDLAWVNFSVAHGLVVSAAGYLSELAKHDGMSEAASFFVSGTIPIGEWRAAVRLLGRKIMAAAELPRGLAERVEHAVPGFLA